MTDEQLRIREYPVLDWSKPTSNNQTVLDAIHGRLKASGFQPGPEGYDTDTLIHELNHRGWGWEIEPEGGGYRGTVIREIAPSMPSTLSSRGWSPAVALARSIDQH